MTDYNWNPPAAEREFRRTIELNPNYAPAHQWYAYLLVASNHPEQAQAEMQRAEEMDPLSPSIGTSAAWISYLQRHYSQSADQCRKVLDLYALPPPTSCWRSTRVWRERPGRRR